MGAHAIIYGWERHNSMAGNALKHGWKLPTKKWICQIFSPLPTQGLEPPYQNADLFKKH